MADLQGNTSSNDVEQEIEVINQKRSALQHLVKLTSTFSRLHQGLNSIILMGSANTQIPEKIINSFKKISEKLTAHPTDQLKNTLASSDIKINRDIKQVLEISLKDETSQAVEIDSRGETTSSLLENNYQNYVDDFKKNAQTSIALRITLKSRNVAVKPFNLSVPENFIKQQIKNLDQKETHCRSKIKQDMDSLDKDMHRLIKRVDFPQEARERLNRMRAELRENIDHFYKDGPLEAMPILQQTISPEMGNTAENPVMAKDALTTSNDIPMPGEINKRQKRSLVNRLREWLLTPASVKWKDINKFE